MKVGFGSQPTVDPRSRAADLRSGSPEQRLRAVAQEFEGLLMNTLLQSMRETVPKSDLIDGGGEIDTYQRMHDDVLTRQLGSGPNGIGIADMIVRRYLPAVEGGETGGAPAAPGTPLAPADPAREFQSVPQTTVPAATRAPRMPVEAPAPQAARGLAAYRRAAMSETYAEALAPAETEGGLQRRAAEVGGAAADSLRRFGDEIHSASRETGVEPELLLAVMTQESAGHADAESTKGARGLMQLMPATAREVGVEDIADPAQNIAGGARYLARMKSKFGDRLDLVLAGYNAGPGAVARAGHSVPDYPETKNYVAKVSSLYERLRGGGQSVGTATP